MQFVADAETYNVIVGSYGSCTGTAAEYALLVDAPSDPSLALVQDNYAPSSTTTTRTSTLSIDLDGTLVP